MTAPMWSISAPAKTFVTFTQRPHDPTTDPLLRVTVDIRALEQIEEVEGGCVLHYSGGGYTEIANTHTEVLKMMKEAEVIE